MDLAPSRGTNLNIAAIASRNAATSAASISTGSIGTLYQARNNSSPTPQIRYTHYARSCTLCILFAMREPRSATEYILRALLLPLSHENLLLSFKPSRFFYELSQTTPYAERTLKASYYRARQSKLIEKTSHDIPRLTPKGRRAAAPFQSTKISNNGKLLVIFDIPETRSQARHEFRRLLKSLGFSQVQLSVWVNEYDHRETVLEAISELNLVPFVKFYEAAELHK